MKNKILFILIIFIALSVTLASVIIMHNSRNNTIDKSDDNSVIYEDTYGEGCQYIRTYGLYDNIKFPKVVLIKSCEELQSYFEQNNTVCCLDTVTYDSDSPVSFKEAAGKYDDNYFKNRVLILVLLREGSGSNRHRVTNVYLDKKNKLNINIITNIPEIGTCDMAYWHLFIEPTEGAIIEDPKDILLTVDGSLAEHS